MPAIWLPRPSRAIRAASLTLLLGAASPLPRAADIVARMTRDEKLTLLHGALGFALPPWPRPPGALGSAGFVPGVPRLGIPALQETDAALGIANPWNARPDDTAVALPSALALAATWDPDTAYRAGTVLGRDAAAHGFNVLLGPGLNLARDPRGGRNFEYGTEDPLLAGTLSGAEIRGIQDQHVIAVAKHFALNDQESGRQFLNVRIDEAAARETDLLAFEIALEIGHPGAVMCAYNRVNGAYSCENPFLLTTVLKGDWHFPGFVMSDWGAVHSSAPAALAGLDQESGEQLDAMPFFAAALAADLAGGKLPAARLDDMARRIVGAIEAAGLFDPQLKPAADSAADLEAARREAAQGAVLLQNRNNTLPLPRTLRRVLIVGGQADAGVLSGGGSSQVVPPGGFARRIAQSGAGPEAFHTAFYDPPSPLSRIAAKLPHAAIAYDDGTYPARAAALAAQADATIIFATQWSGEMQDIPDLALPAGQGDTIAAIAHASPRTIVVLETGGAILLPWRNEAAAILDAWYPGSGGADAIADILFGDAEPAGRLPVTFPASPDDLPVRDIPGVVLPAGTPFDLEYPDAANTGYAWYAAHRKTPAFPFGFGLGFTTCAFTNLRIAGGVPRRVSFLMHNSGARPGACVGEAYLLAEPGSPTLRLLGFARRILPAGQTARAELTIDPRLLARFDAAADRWVQPAGRYRVGVGASSASASLAADIDLPAATAPP